MRKVLIVCPYPEGKAPSQRFRFEQYLPYLREKSVEIIVASFWNDKQWPAIYGGSSIGYRVLSTVTAFVKRVFLLFSLSKYETVFIHREATPIGPSWWEWCAAKVFKKRLIYDFDDAVWLPNSSEANEKLVGKLKNHGKTAKIISWSETVFAGNSFLADYAGRFCSNVIVVPTTIDCVLHHNRDNHTGKYESHSGLTIGWTGTHSTLKQLVPLFPLLEKVYAQIPFRFLLIADVAPVDMPEFVEFRKWNMETEIADLLEMDIGIMPLYDTDWERGKCGFKALQYMALEIPAVVSEVGVNGEIVEDGVTGFVCEAMDGDGEYPKWEDDLLKVLSDGDLRIRLGRFGRERVLRDYSVGAYRGVYGEAIASANPRPLKGSPPHRSDEFQPSTPSIRTIPSSLKEQERVRNLNQLSPKEGVLPENEEGEEPKNSKSDPLEVSGMHYGASGKIFDYARNLRNRMTQPEKVLWEYLRQKPLGFKFRRQHPIHKYVLDFYCHKRRLSIEIDGGYHTDELQLEKDMERTTYLKELGIREIRFSNNQVLNHFQEVVEKIENEML